MEGQLPEAAILPENGHRGVAHRTAADRANEGSEGRVRHVERVTRGGV